MKNIKIETDRLFLRELTENDRDALLELFSDPIAMTYFPSTKTVDEVDEWIRKNLDSYQSNGYGLYLCVLKDSLTPIGYCGFILVPFSMLSWSGTIRMPNSW